MWVYVAVGFMAFWVGFAMKSGGLCTYAAVRQIVDQRRFEKLFIFLGVAAWAGVVLLPLYWIDHSIFKLSMTHSSFAVALLFGAVLGVGAVLNRGCFFGTFVALVGGNLNYLATLFGLSVGVGGGYLYLYDFRATELLSSPLSQNSFEGYLWFGVMAFFALVMLKNRGFGSFESIKRALGIERLSRMARFSMVVIGVGGGVLYGSVSGWNYSDVLSNITLIFLDKPQTTITTLALTATVSMIFGGITAAIYTKSFAFVAMEWRLLLGCFAGGVLMGGASLLIPGGNDGMLLKAIPSLAWHAFVGYIAMLLAMWGLLKMWR